MTGDGALLIRGGRVLDPIDGFDAPADLLIERGMVSARYPRIPESAALHIVDATGMIVCPGFIDLHTHLRYPGHSEKETMGSGTEAAAAGGFTSVCAMANTNPVVDTVEVLQQVLDEAARSSMVRLYQLAAVTVGLRGDQMTDFVRLAKSGAVAFSDDGKPVWNATVMRRALAASRELGMAISAHEEDRDLVGNGVANAGFPARRLGLPEWPCSGEASMVARDLALLEEVGGHLHVAHVSCADTVDLLRAARDRSLKVSAEVTPHHLCMTDVLLDGDAVTGLRARHPHVKVNPPLRAAKDTETLVKALTEGIIDAIATDHAPHTAEDKAQPFETAAFGFTGIETALPLLLGLVRDGKLDLMTMVRRLTVDPARVFGLNAGTLRPGAPADVCVFDPERSWTVMAETLRSRGKNTPLLGRPMVGKVLYTVVGGDVVHSAES